MNNRHASLNLSASPIAFSSLDRTNNILQAIQQTINALAAGLLDDRTARTILYGLQIASANVKRAGKDSYETSHEEIEQQPAPIAANHAEERSECARTSSIDTQHMHEDEAPSSDDPRIHHMNADVEENEEARTLCDAASREVKEQPCTTSPHTYRGSVQMRRMELRQRALAGRGAAL